VFRKNEEVPYRHCFPTLALEYVIRNIQAKQEVLKQNLTNQPMVYANNINSLSESTFSLKRNTQALSATVEDIVLELNEGYARIL